MSKRNIGMHTASSEARRNIIKYLGGLKEGSKSAKSQLGYAAYPEYNFKAPQGAAFSVAKIVSNLEKDGLVRYDCGIYARGYVLTAKGRQALEGGAE